MSERRPEGCQECPKPCIIHVSQVDANGKVQEVHLCGDCPHLLSLEDEATIGVVEAMGESLTGDVGPLPEPCGTCGFSLLDLRRSGKLGCPDCFTAFDDALEALFQRFHRGMLHRGKAPEAYTQLMNARLSEALERRLRAAVEMEDYEAAAKLRDRIESLKMG